MRDNGAREGFRRWCSDVHPKDRPTASESQKSDTFGGSGRELNCREHHRAIEASAERNAGRPRHRRKAQDRGDERDELPGEPLARQEGNGSVLDEGTWRTDGPGFTGASEWVELHWGNTGVNHPPEGTAATADQWGVQSEAALDAATATRKLIAAAKLYGRERVGHCAASFAMSGMIEVSSVHLLKGPPIGAAKPLDGHCTLLPYSDALDRIDAATDSTDFNIAWPDVRSGNLCALEARSFERVAPARERGRYASPLLKYGPDQLAPLLGIVWGSAFRTIGYWRGVQPAAVAALPYRHTTGQSGAGSLHAELPLQGYGAPIANDRSRPRNFGAS